MQHLVKIQALAGIHPSERRGYSSSSWVHRLWRLFGSANDDALKNQSALLAQVFSVERRIMSQLMGVKEQLMGVKQNLKHLKADVSRLKGFTVETQVRQEIGLGVSTRPP